MTRAEIDRMLPELHRLRTRDRFRALDEITDLIETCRSTGYEEIVPKLTLWKGDILLRISRDEEAIATYNECIELSEHLGDKESLNRALGGLGATYVSLADLPKGKELLERAVSVALDGDDIVGRGLALGNLAEVYRQWGLNDLAVGYARDSYDALRGTEQETLPLFRLGALNTTAGDLRSAAEYYREGIAVAKRLGLLVSEGPLRAELAGVYSRMERFEEAKQEYEKAIEIAVTAGDPYNLINAKVLLAANHIKRLEFDEAERQFKELLATADLQFVFVTWCNYYLAYSASRRGNNAEAIAILDVFFGQDEPAREFKLTEGFYALRAETYSAVGDWPNAAKFEKKLREYREETNTNLFKTKLTTAQALIATEREKHEKEIERMKREQLERELSNTTLQLLTQIELLSEFRQGILAVLQKTPPTEAIAKELREKLKVLPCKSIDWDMFETQFTAAHPEFRVTLKQTYPDLTKMELRICTLLRMNLSSPDISQLTCLSERNIENHRYRIRKKLGLSSDESIHEFLAKF